MINHRVMEPPPQSTRRPSIPTSIHQMMNLSEIIAAEHDGIFSSVGDNASVISELTLTTYSDERARILKARFLHRIQQESLTKELSIGDRRMILEQLHEEQALELQDEAEQKQKRQKNDAVGYGDFELFKLHKPPLDEISLSNEEANESSSDDSVAKKTDIKNLRYQPIRQSTLRTQKGSFSSSKTPQRRGSSVDDMLGGEEDELKDTYPWQHMNLSSLVPHETEDNQQGSSKELTHQAYAENEKTNIDEIIKLKLLVANQQATIDTLSSKLHNAELANRQQKQMDQSRVHNLKAENERLVYHLSEYRERHTGLIGRVSTQLLWNTSNRSSAREKIISEDGKIALS